MENPYTDSKNTRNNFSTKLNLDNSSPYNQSRNELQLHKRTDAASNRTYSQVKVQMMS